jgi:hypothetical protein
MALLLLDGDIEEHPGPHGRTGRGNKLLSCGDVEANPGPPDTGYLTALLALSLAPFQGPVGRQL